MATEFTFDGIAAMLQECYFAACGQGYKGAAEEWVPTKQDLDWIEDRIGRKLTRDEREDLRIDR